MYATPRPATKNFFGFSKEESVQLPALSIGARLYFVIILREGTISFQHGDGG
jgi:hypothetical protein